MRLISDFMSNGMGLYFFWVVFSFALVRHSLTGEAMPAVMQNSLGAAKGEAMADVWNAYNFLNDSLKLGLSREDLSGVEATFLKQWMAQKNYPRQVIETASSAEWEFFLHLQPVKKNID